MSEGDIPYGPRRNRPGWDLLRREREGEFRGDFVPLREVIQRNELVGSMVELFLSALVGVTKISLNVQDVNGESISDDLDASPSRPPLTGDKPPAV